MHAGDVLVVFDQCRADYSWMCCKKLYMSLLLFLWQSAPELAIDMMCGWCQAEEVVSVLNGCEEEARRGHSGIWIHGDPGSESDDEEAAQKPSWGRR